MLIYCTLHRQPGDVLLFQHLSLVLLIYRTSCRDKTSLWPLIAGGKKGCNVIIVWNTQELQVSSLFWLFKLICEVMRCDLKEAFAS